MSVPLPPSDPAQPLPDSLPPGEREWPLHERLLGAAVRAAALSALPALFLTSAALIGPGPRAGLSEAAATVCGLWVALGVPFLLERPDRGAARAVAGWVLGLALGAAAALPVQAWVKALLSGGTPRAYEALGELDGDALGAAARVLWTGAALGVLLAPWSAARAHGRALGEQARGLGLAAGGCLVGSALAAIWTRQLWALPRVIGLELVYLAAAALAAAPLVVGERLAARVDRGAPGCTRGRAPAQNPFWLAVLGGLLLGQPARLWRTERYGRPPQTRSDLFTLEGAQRAFHDLDEDQNGRQDMAGSLAALIAHGVLGREFQDGDVRAYYTIRLVRSRRRPESVWAVALDPRPDRGGEEDRHLALDSAGQVWVSDAPIPLDPDTCLPLPGSAAQANE